MEFETHHSGEHPKSAGGTRRDFLRATAVGAGLMMTGQAMAQDAPAPAPEMAPAPHNDDGINVALIGSGGQGMVLLDSLARIKGVRITAFCDIWDYSLKRGVSISRKYGHVPTGYTDYRDLLDHEKDVQAVFIATPDFMHAEHAIACMNAGLHVYCEPPLAHSLRDAKRMIAEARSTGRIFQVGLQRRSNPRYLHAIQTLIRGRSVLGRITHGSAQWNRNAGPDLGWPKKYEIPEEVLKRYGYDTMHRFRNWRWYRKFGGGPLVSLGSLQIDVLNWAFGALPHTVYATGGIEIDSKCECWDNALCTLEYDTPAGPVRASYEVMSTNSYGRFHELIHGRYGSLVISEHPDLGDHFVHEIDQRVDMPWEKLVQEGLLGGETRKFLGVTRNAIINTTDSKLPYVNCFPLPVEFHGPQHQPHVDNFLDAVRAGAKLNGSPEESYRVSVILDAIDRSIRKRKPVGLKPSDFQV